MRQTDVPAHHETGTLRPQRRRHQRRHRQPIRRAGGARPSKTKMPSLIIISNAKQTEADIAELETYEEKQMSPRRPGLKESGCNRLIKAISQPAEPRNLHHRRRNGSKGMDSPQRLKAPQCAAGVIPPTSGERVYPQKSSSTKTTLSMAVKPPCAKPENWAWKAKEYVGRTETSCTSASTYKNNRKRVCRNDDKLYVLGGQ